MSQTKTDALSVENLEAESPQRRNLAMALFGALGGAALLEACADTPELSGQVSQLLSGSTSLFWCDTYAELRLQQGGTLSTSINVAVVRGSASGPPYAGGGGIFVWEPSVTIGENGGTIIVPTTSPTGRWVRQYSGSINVKWFGTVGTGLVDDRLAIQNAIDFAHASAVGVSWTGNGASSFAAYSAPVVFLPKGIYALGANPGQTMYPLDPHGLEVPGPLTLQGETGTILQPLAAVGNTISLVRVGGSVNIRDITFVNGFNSIALMGPTAAYGILNPQGQDPILIDRCRFETPRAVAIWQDCTPTGNPLFYRSFQHPLYVTNFYFTGPTLFWGTGDYVLFQGGNIGWDQTNIAPPISTDQLPLGLINSAGHTILDNCEITPTGSASGSPAWPARNVLFVGGSTIQMHNVIQFDIAACVARSRLVDNKYQGHADSCIQIPNDGVNFSNLQVTLSDCTLNAIGKNLIEVYEVFPREVRITNLTESLIGPSRGMWLENGVSLTTTLQQHAINQVLKVFVYRTPGYAPRIRQSSDALSQSLTGAGVKDVTGQLQAYFFGDPYEENVAQVPASPNLFLPGIYSPSQLVQFGGDLGGSGDSLTGYTVQDWTSTNPPGPFSFITQAWGASMPAGVYCFSMYVLANFSGEWMFGYIYNGQPVNLGARRFHASLRLAGPTPPRAGHYQRLWFSFYFPGGGATFQFQGACYPGESGNYMAYGLFAIHPGATPAPYTFPVDVASAPTKNVTTSKILGVYYAASGPPGAGMGTYVAGDRIVLDPPSGGIQEWICTIGGTPGTWVPVPTGAGAIALGTGATSTLGKIGGAGPTAAAQSKWLKVVDATGATYFVPAWQ